MRIGLVSYRCENRNTEFNMRQIELAMQRAEGKADMLCFGEAFLQGFDALCWDYDTDRETALELSSETIDRLKGWTVQYGIALATGYIEREQDKLYSSYAVIADGGIIHNYRRISKGWKEYSKTEREMWRRAPNSARVSEANSSRPLSSLPPCTKGLSPSTDLSPERRESERHLRLSCRLMLLQHGSVHTAERTGHSHSYGRHSTFSCLLP